MSWPREREYVERSIRTRTEEIVTVVLDQNELQHPVKWWSQAVSKQAVTCVPASLAKMARMSGPYWGQSQGDMEVGLGETYQC